MQRLFKGFTVSLMVIILMALSRNVAASNNYFVWEKTVIDVPVFSSLESYKDDYKVKLYVNGVESMDFKVDYEVNASTFSTVLTNKVGRYTVYYKAYSKNNYVSSTQAIIFNVIDITAPQITLINDIVEVELGNKLPDNGWFRVSDNTCSINDLAVKIDDCDVIYEAVGTYNCRLNVSDLYGNVSNHNFKVKIIDKTKPSITILKPLVFNYKEEVNIFDYIECSDNSNVNISNRLEVEGLDTSKLGDIELVLKLTDYSGNYQELILGALVVDEEEPLLILTANEDILDIKEFNSYDTDFFKEYIQKVRDNYSTTDKIKIEIKTANLECKVADFLIHFVATDENNNQTKIEFIVKLRELVGPEIICDETIYINLGEDVDLYSLVTIYDEFDEEAQERLMVEQPKDFQTHKEGIYHIKYTCFNTSGVYSEKIVKVIVGNPDNNLIKVDYNIPPLTIVIGSLVILCLVGFGIYKLVLKRKNINH